MDARSSTKVALRLGARVAGRAVSLLAADEAGAPWTFRGAARVDGSLDAFLAEAVAHVDPQADARMFDVAAGTLDLRIDEIAVRYQAGSGAGPDAAGSAAFAAACTLGAGASTVNATVFFSRSGPGYVLGFELPGALTLASAPLVGPLLSSIAVDALRVVSANQAVPAATTLAIPATGPDGMAAADRALAFDTGIAPGLSLACVLDAGTAKLPLSYPLAARADRLLLASPPPGAAAAPGPAQAPTIKWIPVQKTLGPLTIAQVGAGWMPGVGLLLDASVTLAGMTLGLRDFSVTFPLSVLTDPLHPSLDGVQVGLGGLSLAYEAGTTRISGAFLRVPGAAGASDDYVGEALLSTAGFTLGALGAYANAAGGPSLFVFALLQRPLGGPPFFFVTGVAAGFGYNRALRIPTLDALPAFPLVAAAVATRPGQNPFAQGGADPAAALDKLHDYVTPQAGAQWLAAGVRFTSFEMVESYALLAVIFGAAPEVALLGQSTLTVPAGDPSPIGFAKMALVATFRPDTGLLAVAGKLTPESYVLSGDCHLSGGFAFSAWFQDSADGTARAGDFVVTLGGYHPSFDRPPSYPGVARLAANWQVSPNLAVKGAFYFALTPAAVMGGGAMSANWQSGDLRAWFDVDADFLLAWKPFHYNASVRLSLGASYTLDLLFTSETITVCIGAQLDLWGPPFAGKAHVDLYVVSFTVSFGDSAPATDTIGWDDFKRSFLPKPNAPAPATGLGAADAAPVMCSARVAAGLVRDLGREPAAGLDWELDPEGFAIVTTNTVPAKSASFVTGDAATSQPRATELHNGVPTAFFKPQRPWSTAFGIGPMGVADGNLVSTLTVTLRRIVRRVVDGAPAWQDDWEYDFSVDGRCQPVLANVPLAAWSGAAALAPSVEALNTSPRTIADALVGFTLRPQAGHPGHSLPMDLGTLEITRGDQSVDFTWGAPDVPTADAFDQDSAMDTFKRSLMDPVAAGRREDIICALRHQDVAVDTLVDVRGMAAMADSVLLHAPALRLLGEMPRRVDP